jgi:prephenate dehydratase
MVARMKATESPLVAFQGELGAYSEEAVTALFGVHARPDPRRENADVAAAVLAGDAAFGVLPVENSLAGTVAATYDAVVTRPGLFVIAECTLPIHHCLLAPRGATIESLRIVESHPVALAQCRSFFERHPHVTSRAAYDTAGAARDVAAAGDPSRGAIASQFAAGHYSLEILARNIEDRHDNRTRFVAIAREAATLSDGTPARTLLVVTTKNVPGALLHVLQPLAARGLNLSKLESRPTGEAWRYRFVLEFEHLAGDPLAREAIDEMRDVASACEILGTVAAAS